VESKGESATGCLDEDVALGFVQGGLPEGDVRRIDEHVDRCEGCRLLLDEAVRAFRGQSTSPTPTAPAPLTRISPGDTLAGRYRILRFIARGGMGEVYDAYDQILNTRLAVKTLAATTADHPQAIRRLKLEVNLARRITHPNVCRIFDLGVHNPLDVHPDRGILFITMELVPGTSLGHRLRAGGRMSARAALPIVQAMVSGMEAAHQAGVVHRDFKSDNVMLAPGADGKDESAPRVVVMDFGLARSPALSGDSSSLHGPALTGTLAYMAPEQLQGTEVGPAADVFALGIVIFEMLTGTLPFVGETPVAAAWKRVTEKAPLLRTFAPELDPRWEAIVSRCLERDPLRRPASVRQVADALVGAEVSAGASVDSARRSPGRSRGLRVAGLMVGAALGLSPMVAWRLTHRLNSVVRTPAAIASRVATGGAGARPPGPEVPAPGATAATGLLFDMSVRIPGAGERAPAPKGSSQRHTAGRRTTASAGEAASDLKARRAGTPPAGEAPSGGVSDLSRRARSADPEEGFIF
jgi:serine/threonine protein kinase